MFKLVVTKVKNRSVWLWEIMRDPIVKFILPKPKIATIEETIQKIVEDKASIARYGDGELDIMKGSNIPFQEYDKELARKMREILKVNKSDFLVGLSDIYGDLSMFKEDARIYWKRNIRKNRIIWNRLLVQNKQYYNTFISRFYYGFKDKSHCQHTVELLKKIWDGRKIVIVEGEKSRLGVGNDLFDNAMDIKRVLCPATNAFSVYQEIIDAVIKFDKECLILLAIGPTATAMAYDLYELGYQTLDIGHIDIEYEWYLMKADTKVAVKDKYTNEAITEDATNIGESTNQEYLSQIVDVIGK